ncbi:GLPGLI family protein [Tenacibaculum sp. 1B UA]|uniref:GLPGLI family protein n=1 Tax=Tenacibaculum sp. 1B UA TaxID=2922252 RepID=UPI002A248132|nr:GLPGLI family protein [Tenacibaculum sp. 1B UA]MDX8553443.1 GLPGLI family protein [Tenacibaculum sp. 1B UA]
MKKIVILIILLNFYSTIAQTNGRITYKAFFSESQASEKLRSNNIKRYQEILDEEMMAKMLIFNLDFNKDESLFYLSKNLISEHENQETKKYVTGLFYGYDKIYINKAKNQLIEQLYYSSGSTLKSRKASFIKWNLSKETKSINGYKCYKATYTYIQKWRGREFPWKVTAWYTLEIPLQYGPIRYSGLPGLILELSEKDRGFIVDKITFMDKKIKIKIPDGGKS